ncbi:MAG TPA: hypothetical protein VK425_08835, partial [Acidimicrobiales bacterium]|nr:hypothetical protein [Acidimicrobiales bacterium]
SWLLENLRRPGRPDSVPRGRAVARFLAEFARRDAYDFLDWRDMRPAFSEMARLVDKWALHRGRPRTVKLRGTFGELPSSTTGELGGER